VVIFLIGGIGFLVSKMKQKKSTSADPENAAEAEALNTPPN